MNCLLQTGLKCMRISRNNLDMWVLKPGDLFDKRYRIQREIGSGGMSFVYAAEAGAMGLLDWYEYPY